jgi:hypothetical protein
VAAAFLAGAVIALGSDPTDRTERRWRATSALRAQNAGLRDQLQRERARARLARARVGRKVIARPSVDHAIRLGAAAFGLSPERMRRVAQCESELDSHNVTGPYVGLFQFGVPLWSQTPFGAFERTDPYAAALAAAWAFARGWEQHWPVCSRA